MDKRTHSLIQQLKQNGTVTDLDMQLLGIQDVTGIIGEAKRQGYIIKRRYESRLWNRNKVYYLKN
jgi:hypothetical protein